MSKITDAFSSLASALKGRAVQEPVEHEPAHGADTPASDKRAQQGSSEAASPSRLGSVLLWVEDGLARFWVRVGSAIPDPDRSVAQHMARTMATWGGLAILGAWAFEGSRWAATMGLAITGAALYLLKDRLYVARSSGAPSLEETMPWRGMVRDSGARKAGILVVAPLLSMSLAAWSILPSRNLVESVAGTTHWIDSLSSSKRVPAPQSPDTRASIAMPAPLPVTVAAPTETLPTHETPLTKATTASDLTVEAMFAANKDMDFSRARRMAASLANQGVAEAYGFYGWLIARGVGYKQGDGTSDNVADSVSWLDKALAANPNDSWALTARGMTLTEGWIGQRDVKAGFPYLEKAAANGNEQAMHALGMYNIQPGYLPRPNYPQARKWFSMAADKGSASDLYNVGLMDWEGRALPRPDRKRAMENFKKAADMSEPRAAAAMAAGHP